MSGFNKVSHGDDQTYEAVDAALAGGVLVIPSTTATVNAGLQGVKVATAGALNVLGVSARSALPVANQTTSGTDSDGFPIVSPNQVSELLTVYSKGVFNLTFTAVAVAHGTRLKAAAGGAVAAFVHGTDDPSMVIGYCVQPGGVSSAGGLGLVKNTLRPNAL